MGNVVRDVTFMNHNNLKIFEAQLSGKCSTRCYVYES